MKGSKIREKISNYCAQWRPWGNVTMPYMVAQVRSMVKLGENVSTFWEVAKFLGV